MIRFEWGIHGVEQLAPLGGVAIIVDVLSFSTCVDIACSRGAQVLPYRFKDASAQEFASAHAAVLASARSQGGLSLSPQSLQGIAPGTRLVLPSPNGSTLTLACQAPIVLAGCLRNAAAVAAYASRHPGPVTVIAAGERWEDGSLRPAVEDLLGAGAIIRSLQGVRSVEAAVAEAAFAGVHTQLATVMRSCVSGEELLGRGFGADVALAAALDASTCIPRLVQGAYTRVDA